MADDPHKADLDRVSNQNSVTDFARGVEERPTGGGFLTRMVNGSLRTAVEATPYGKAVKGSTDFDQPGLSLNQLVDLVEQTDPEDLESSGKALWDAREAIKAAAEELDGHIGNVHWVGESGDAFRTWGRSLVTSTHALSDFAGGAGDQITAAAVGLASVRTAMPSRDMQPNRKRPDTFTEAEKAANKDEYAAAVKVEKDRQEAINQMNRLASYYAVSTEQLASLNKDSPEFKDMPDVGVPKPARYAEDPGSLGSGSSGANSSGSTAVTGHHPTVASSGHATVHGTSDTSFKDVTGRTTSPGVPVQSNIDSVGTLPPTLTTPVTAHTPPAMGTPVTGGSPTSGLEGAYGTPISKGTSARGMGGAGGARTPVSAQGRAGAPGSGVPRGEGP